MSRLASLSLLALIVACGIKGAPKPSRKPPPKATPPAAVTAIPAREASSGAQHDGGTAATPLLDAGVSLDGGALPAVDGGADAGR